MVGRVVVSAGASSFPWAVLWNSTQLGSLGISHVVCLLWVGSAVWQGPERMSYLRWKGGNQRRLPRGGELQLKNSIHRN